jgi:quinol monooxygenase YgiN
MSKVTVIARVQARPGREEELRDELLSLLAPTRIETGCIDYDLHQSQEEPGLFLLFESWASREDLERHLESVHLRAFQRRAEGLLASPPEVSLYRRLG